jgi:VIT1/CCC1 family predicted Fe2+/Mn2+ transporter
MAIITGTFGLIPVVLLVAFLVTIVPSMIFTGLMGLVVGATMGPSSRGSPPRRRSRPLGSLA